MPDCVEYLTEHHEVNFFGYQPTFHPEAPFRDWCAVPVALHLHLSKTQSYPTNAANEILKSWDWVEGSVTVSDPGLPIFSPPPPDEPEGEIFVPLPPFPLDLELPPAIYGGIYCGSEPGPPGEQGPPGDVNIESMQAAVEETDDTHRRNFNLAIGAVSIHTPENFCAAIQVAAPNTVQCVGQILQAGTPELQPTAELREEDGAPPSFDTEVGENGETHFVLTLPTGLNDSMEMVAFDDTDFVCQTDGAFETIGVQHYAVADRVGSGPGAIHSDATWRQNVTRMLLALLRCCNPCSRNEYYAEWTMSAPFFVDAVDLEKVELVLHSGGDYLHLQDGNPNVGRFGRFTWLYKDSHKTGRVQFWNYDHQFFFPEGDKDIVGFAVVPTHFATVRMRLYGVVPPDIATTQPKIIVDEDLNETRP